MPMDCVTRDENASDGVELPQAPDAPVALLQLDAAGRVVAANRAAIDLLGPISDDAGRPWDMPFEALASAAGVWVAPGGDPARCVRYQRDRDGAGWWLSLPHPETAALLREAAMLATDACGETTVPVLRPLALRLRDDVLAQRRLERIGTLLSHCDLDLEPEDGAPVTAQARRLAAGFGNLAEAIRQAVALSVKIADEIPRLIGENDELVRQSRAQVDALGGVRDGSRRLLQGLQAVTDELQAVREAAASADDSARSGTEAARALAAAMQEVERKTARAGEVIEVIDTVAFQTNILSVNARIEAAHAGEAGRGFAVVAAEIRRLAERAASASRDVRVIIGETVAAVGEGAASAQHTGAVLDDIGGTLARAGDAMTSVAARIATQAEEVAGIDRAVGDVAALGRSNLEYAAHVAERSEALGHDVASLHDCVGLFRLPPDPMREPRHAQVLALATASATLIGEALGHAIGTGDITPAALFSRDYAQVPDVEPAKFQTAFDDLCDRLLPPLQEPVLEAHPWIVFAICANPDGYVPTHNLRFSQPLTGDRERDLVGNRTKRIFNDRVGGSVGTHTDPWRLQVYRRDTGQIMFDLSVPVYVDDRHWGGFRVGYSLE